MNEESKFVTVTKAASMLLVGERQIYNLLNAGKIQSIKVASSRLISVDSLLAYERARFFESLNK